MPRANDWLEQANQDLDHARKSRDIGDYSWACFAGQQAAEKAVNALHLRFGQVAWGNSVFQLLEGLERLEVPGDVLEAAKVLDKHYIGPRYPDVHWVGVSIDIFPYTLAEVRQALNEGADAGVVAVALEEGEFLRGDRTELLSLIRSANEG